jgi:hypothetical protein
VEHSAPPAFSQLPGGHEVDTSAHLNLSSVRLNWLRGRLLLTIASYRFVIRAAMRDVQRVCINLVHSNWRCECALIGCQLLKCLASAFSGARQTSSTYHQPPSKSTRHCAAASLWVSGLLDLTAQDHPAVCCPHPALPCDTPRKLLLVAKRAMR